MSKQVPCCVYTRRIASIKKYCDVHSWPFMAGKAPGESLNDALRPRGLYLIHKKALNDLNTPVKGMIYISILPYNFTYTFPEPLIRLTAQRKVLKYQGQSSIH